MKFIDKLNQSFDKQNSHLCIGLDSRYDRLPEIIKKNSSVQDAIFNFNKKIIEATHDITVAYKLNVAFYAGFGQAGLEGLRLTNEYLRNSYNDTPVIADCKRSEMGESVSMIKREIFDWLRFDCVMVTPWFGLDTVKAYLENEEAGVCVYVHDSNPSAVEFQDLELKNGRRVYQVVAENVSKNWNTNGNVFVEAGLTYPKQLKQIRKIIGEDMPMLVSGVGLQGGKIEDLSGAFGKNGKRLMLNSSRNIIFAGENKSDYFVYVRKAAEDLRNSLLLLSKTTGNRVE
jgi:orotidine-5'-phosphate decarboxylase